MSRPDEKPLQFSLRHLFWAVTLICVYCAIVRVLGGFIAGLVLGVLVLRCTLIALRIENFLLSAIAGMFTAIILYFALSLVHSATSGWLLMFGWIVYPLCGYVL